MAKSTVSGPEKLVFPWQVAQVPVGVSASSSATTFDVRSKCPPWASSWQASHRAGVPRKRRGAETPGLDESTGSTWQAFAVEFGMGSVKREVGPLVLLQVEQSRSESTGGMTGDAASAGQLAVREWTVGELPLVWILMTHGAVELRATRVALCEGGGRRIVAIRTARPVMGSIDDETRQCVLLHRQRQGFLGECAVFLRVTDAAAAGTWQALGMGDPI